jgi:MoxR-like ATPase
MTNDEIKEYLQNCHLSRPNDIIMDDLSWKYLVRAILRGKNTLIVGPTRCGKTKAVQCVVQSLEKESVYFYFNLGSTQDARATLVGNTTFKKEHGTVFHQSEFVKAIQTPGAVILLDELSRGHHDAWNILMPVLDPTQRYLRLDEAEDSSIVNVAEGVTFIATANVGNEYTATRVMDKALTSRFPVIVEMQILTDVQELQLLRHLYPKVSTSDYEIFKTLAQISYDTKLQCRMSEARITTYISTAALLDMADLVIDGFSVPEIIRMTIFPLYSADGGAESERVYVKQLVQKYVGDMDVTSPINDPNKQRFNFD